jgi:hypothetical protein
VPATVNSGPFEDLPVVDGGLKDRSCAFKYLKLLHGASGTEDKLALLNVLLNENTSEEFLAR